MRKRFLWTAVAAVGAIFLLVVDAQAQGIRVGVGGGGGGIRIGTGGGGWGPGLGQYNRGGFYGPGNYGRGGFYGPGSYGRSGFGININPGIRSSYYGRPYYGGSYYSGQPYYGGSYYGSQPYYSASPSYGTYSDGSYESAEPMGTLQVTVNVPRPDAKVTFNGVTSTSTGTSRNFETSYMAPGRPYNFDVHASWMENGKEVHQRRTITGQAGQSLTVDFGRDASATGASDTDRTDRTPGLTPPPVVPDRDTTPGTDRTPGVSKDRLPGTEVDRAPGTTGSDRLPGGTVDRVPDVDRDPLRDPLRDRNRDKVPAPID
jgi:uncharacterized protein (TIGR03000 family)